MTSTASQQPANAAPNNAAAPAATSYASAAGAAKKPSSTPVVATGSNQPIVAAGSSALAPNHAKSSSVSPMNGRPNIMPAVPVPAVAHGTSTINGQVDHNRKSSVTMSGNGLNSYSTNGASAGAKPGIQFGYQDSPSVSHSTPQPPSAPVPIPGASGRGVAEPRHSPSPIPQPSASGGRPPSGAAPSSSTLAFGSFDNDRSHMRTSSTSQDPNALGPQHSPHIRRNSNVSDISNHAPPQPGGMGRGNFSGGPRGGRTYSGGFNPSMGYPPNNYNRNQQGNQGRSGMPPNFGGNGRPPHPYGTPPQQNRSPAMAAAMPQPVPSLPPGQIPGYYFSQPIAPNQQNYYQGPYDHRGAMQPMPPIPTYPAYQSMQGSPLTHYQQPAFVPGPYNPPAPQPMSRSNSSQISDQRPASSTGQSQAPIAQGTPQQQAAQLKPVVAQSPFTRPTKRSSAVTITNEAGEAIDLRNLKPPPPASPASITQQSRTPPVISSTPTPPPKTSTPKPFIVAHGRTDSASNLKTAEEKRNEFMEKIKQTATNDKAKEDETAKPSSDKASTEARPITTPPFQGEIKATESAKEVMSEKTAGDGGKETPAAEQPVAKPLAESEDDDLERIIREMEEADARREKEEEERRVKRDAETAAKKKLEEENRAANAAENDRKLREQEREMERLEEEKERKRAAARSSATESTTELLKKSTLSADTNTGEVPSPANEVAAKMPSLGLNDKQSPTVSSKPSPSGRAPKPQALNLTQLSTKAVEPPQPSAALQSLKTARLLDVIKTDIYPPGINSPNPALNAAVTKKGTSFKYDSAFLLQFKAVFTEQPSVDFHQQVKALIGDGDGGRSASNRSGGGSGRQSTRGSTSSFPMGSFGTSGVAQLPAGTTSAQRFEMSNKAMSRPGMNAMASFQRPGGAFGGGSQMSRTPSSNMGMPHSPRQSSRRNASKPNTVNTKAEAQAAKNMPLTQGLKIDALQISATGWKPLTVGKPTAVNAPPSQSGLMDPAMVQRKVKAALNKMTPENFDRISDQILEIAAQSKEETDGRTLRQVIQLTFEKATDESHWASMYAKFCKKMLETMSPDIRDENIKDRTGNVVSGGALFRKYLLNRCQEEFERGWTTDLPAPKEGEDQKTAAAVLLSDEYYKAAAAKRRGLGLVQFIGELYKLGMLTERIMHECVRKLVDYSGIPDEAEVESLCKLLRTIGGNLDAAEKGKPMMDAYFQRIQNMIDLPNLPSRLQFMLMDVVDLRKANWVSKEANKGPKTLDEVRAEAEALAAQKAAEAARSNQRGGGGRAQLGRGDVRHMPGGFPQSTPNQVGIDDLRRLKGGASRQTSTNLTLGPMSMLNSRSNSGRRLGPGGSLSRGADDSGASSRTGTPPVRETPTSTNSFGLLASIEPEHPGSPPSTAASPALAKATPEASTAAEKGGN
ncbi:putative eukaryotic translation initiation factor 4 gamma [Rosellinia necatrix]|uniref:Putative eukaryotic translation initiation factor 4 gamma n=1 Tax=Rosellinia necatrix TaxID=77044 RepID=A0A1W2TLM5_ROSNE|nr:putative eukaryotic translation initiation factor 4 gamma [Rosellinia necatrix]